MENIPVNRFDGGIAESRFSRTPTQCGVCKHFDITTFPYKLVPYRGLAANTIGQAQIGNIIVGSNGIPFGVGTVANNNNNGQLYNKNTIAGNWVAMSNGVPGAIQGSYRVLTEFMSYIYQSYGTKAGGAFNDGSAAGIWWTAMDNSVSNFQAFSAGTTSVSNGVVHPATGYLYVGHANLIAEIQSVGGTYTDAKLTLPSNAVITGITPFGNNLAIAARIGSSTAPRSKVFIWDLSSNTWTLAIDWGTGDLQILNEYYGLLIGVSVNAAVGYSIDRNGIMIKSYSNGGIPQKIREISTERQTTTAPSAKINPNVNFIHNDKLYFSADIVGGSTSPKYYGLWSLSKSPFGQWSVAIEQGATSDNSETSILAAAKANDYVWMVHTAVGTVVRNIDASDGDFSSTSFNTTAFYETVVNPNMPEEDYHKPKALRAFRVIGRFPDPTSQITVNYRTENGTTFTKIFDKTSAGSNATTGSATGNRATRDTNGGQFLKGRYYEFRLESIGGAEILGYDYEYDTEDE